MAKLKEALVSGAGGFVGSHLVEKLINSNFVVNAFVRYNSRNDWGMLELLPKDKLDQIEVVTGDIRDYEAIKYAVKDSDMVLHLSSVISIPYSYTHSKEVFDSNVMGALNLMNACREYSIDKIVHTSTSEVYGTAKYVPIDEDHPLQAQSPYSASKIAADKIAESFHNSFDLPIATIRPFNTYGPRQSARAIIPTIITQALITDKVHLGSLHPTRDYTYVNDVVEAFIKIAKSKNTVGEVINIGSNTEISMGDLAHKIVSIMDKDIDIVSEDKRTRPESSEVDRLWCDNTKAQKTLAWRPKMDLEKGLKETIDWLKENIKYYKPDIYNI